LEELLGKDFGGIVSSDRWWAYELIDASRQACWSHLDRDFAFHAAGALLQQKQFGQAGLALTKRLFEAWRAFGEHQDRDRLAREMAPIQAELHKLLEHAARKSTYTRFHRRFANNPIKIWRALWTFVTVEGVQPTNNAAERALRGPVIYRKLFARHPIRRRRAVHRAGAVGLGHMPPARPLAVRLHPRADHRPRPRRSTPSAGLTPRLHQHHQHFR
jgi:hypothetical protein